MKNKLLLFVLLVVSFSYVYSDSLYKLYEAEWVQTYKGSDGYTLSGYSAIGIINMEIPSQDIEFDKNGILYIVESSRRRILIMDQNYLQDRSINFSKNLEFIYADEIELHDDGISANILGQYFMKISYEGELIYKLSITGNSYDHFRYKNSIFYISSNSQNIYLVPELTVDEEENDNNWMNNETVKKLFLSDIEKNKYGFTDLNIRDGYLYQKGVPVLRNFKVFKSYWTEKHKGQKKPEYIVDLGGSLSDLRDFYYKGMDKDFNTYWISVNKFLVFNKDGWLIDAFTDENDFEDAEVAIHPSGDVYYLVFYENDAKLYRIKRVWGIDKTSTNKKLPQSATLNDSYVRLRDAPNLSSNKIGTLMKDDKVEILDQTTEKMKIGDMESVWYKVKTSEGKVGWCYGWFLDLKE